MWMICFGCSASCLLLAVILALAGGIGKKQGKSSINPFHVLFAGVFVAVLFLFLPVYAATISDSVRVFLLSIYSAMQVFTIGCDFNVVKTGAEACPAELQATFQLWAAVLFVLAPICTFGFVLSLFKNLSAHLKYWFAYFRDAYIFSELNDKSLALATDLRNKSRRNTIVFMDVFDDNGEKTFELAAEAKKLGAICFKKDILAPNFKNHSSKKNLLFFAIGNDETENLNQTLRLIEKYRTRKNTHLYVFSTKLESELLLTAVDRGNIKLRRVNEVRSLINRLLYEQGEVIFQNAKQLPDGKKHISAVVVGMGRHGVEMLKALAWYGQMDGYTLEIDAFDKDPLAEEKFAALAPELMSPDYNGVAVEGEAQYRITIHSGVDVDTATFMKMVEDLENATYVLVALGDDERNVRAAVNLRMYFARKKRYPTIQTILYNSQQKYALQGIKNYRGQEYDIDFVGDVESSYTEAVILDSELEEEALRRHMKWGEEASFWTYEYNYRSSMATAIHRHARIQCGIPGADKKEEDLTESEKKTIEQLEHRRWNAYMRAEGYIFSGSKDAASRNDLAKMHHDLVEYAALSEEEKRKDSRVGTD